MDFSAAFTRLIELLYVNYGIGGMMKGTQPPNDSGFRSINIAMRERDHETLLVHV